MKQDDNRVTEQPSPYEDLRGLSLRGLLEAINREDAKVHRAVARTIPVMERLVEQVVARMERGGRAPAVGWPSPTHRSCRPLTVFRSTG